jgi:hypothetical protein
MEVWLGIGGVLLVVAILVLPVSAMVSSNRARRRLDELEEQNRSREKELRYLYEQLKRLKEAKAVEDWTAKRAAEAKAVEATAAPADATLPSAPAAGLPGASAGTEAASAAAVSGPRATPPLGAPSPVALGASEAASIAAAAVGGEPLAGPAPTLAASASASGAGAGAGAAADTASPGGASGARPPRPPRSEPSRPSKPARSLEQEVATWFTRVGSAAVLLGVLYFFKYAVDNDWIGPAGRVALGILAGLAFLVTAEVVRKTTKPAFVHGLVGLGLAAIFISVYASSAFYQLLPTEAAFAANAAVLLVGTALAWHHKGEPILVLVLIAGFANPVMLSTGVDRPFALFAYLFAVTSVTLAVSTKLRFRYAISLAVLGTAVVFTGWYDKFFDVHDFRATANIDLPPEKLVGAYLELGARLVPLAFVGLFTAQWIAAGFRMRTLDPERGKFFAVPLVLAALLASHAGLAALLYDHPRWLGGGMIAAGAAAVLSLSALERTELLLVPMLASFGILAFHANSAGSSSEQVALLGLLGVWSAIYVFTFLRAADSKLETITPGAAIRSSLGLLAFAALGAIMLLPHQRTVVFAALLAGVSGVIALIAVRAKLLWLVGAALATTLFALLGAAEISGEHHGPVDYSFLGLAAVWAGVYLGAELTALGRRLPATGLGGTPAGSLDDFEHLLTLSGPGLAFIAVAITSTSSEVSTLRALLVAAVGAVDLLLARYVAQHETKPAWVAILCAQALGLFAAAMGFALTGASITIVWAVLCVITAMIAARSKEPVWAVALGLLVLATLGRLLGADIAEAEQAVDRWRASLGREGLYRLRPFFNARAYAMLGTGIGFIASALELARGAKKAKKVGPEQTLRRTGAAVLSILGYAALIGLVVVEARALFLELPMPPPMLLDSVEFNVFLEKLAEAERAQVSKLAMVTTVVLAGAAMTLLGLGFALEDAFHRRIGLALFLATTLKLAAWDVWNLARTYQIVVLVVVGVLLLGAGFMYARLKTLFADKPSAGPGAAAFALLLGATLALGAGEARADDSGGGPAPVVELPKFASVAALNGIDAPGDYRFTVGLEIYRASLAADLLADLRIAGPGGHAVPHLVQPTAAPADTPYTVGRRFDPGLLPDGSRRATFELPPEFQGPHCEVSLDLTGPSTYLLSTRIETGDRPQAMARVAEGSMVYRMEDGPRSSTLRYPESVARYVRITLFERHPASGGASVEIDAARFSCETPRSTPPQQRFPLSVGPAERNAEQKTTVFELDAGGEGVPIERLVVETAAPEFVRRVTVMASSYKSAWPVVASGMIYRVEGYQRREESLTIPVPAIRKRWIRIQVQDGDDAPLAITGVAGELTEREVLLRAAAGGEHQLYVGDKAGRVPSYDLRSILERKTAGVASRTIAVGALSANPEFGKEPSNAHLPLTEQHRGAIGVGLGVVLLGLALWAVRLLKTAERAEAEKSDQPRSLD